VAAIGIGSRCLSIASRAWAWGLPYVTLPANDNRKACQSLWRTGDSPKKSHIGFVDFLRFLGHIRNKKHQVKVAKLFKFSRFVDFQNWLTTLSPIAYDLERLTPDLANDGPNPEYPWPHSKPKYAPVLYSFTIWKALTSKGQGRDLLRFIQTAVREFPVFAEF
jgi:hypothetical protein